MWLFYAFLSAIGAALVAIFGKIGLKQVDSTLATTLRAIVMAGLLTFVSILIGKFKGFKVSNIKLEDWGFIILAAIAGAASWLFYFLALKTGDASKVVAVDRLSLVFVVLLAAVFLSERITLGTILGTLLMVAGAFLITGVTPLKVFS